MASAEQHITISRRFIAQADAELAAGDLLQASEKAWGATAHRIKAIAQRRGWRHGSHADIGRIAMRLGRETRRLGQMEFLFAAANDLHVNFYEIRLPERRIRRNITRVKHLLVILDRIDR